MSGAMKGTKRHWNQAFDLIPSFSDSDEIPDLDGDTEDDDNDIGLNAEYDTQNGAKNKKSKNAHSEPPKAKTLSKKQEKAAAKQRVNSGEEHHTEGWADRGEKDGSFNPNFQFDDLDTLTGVEEGFTPWAVSDIIGNVGTRRGVDDIIRRRKEREKLEAENAKNESEDQLSEDSENGGATVGNSFGLNDPPDDDGSDSESADASYYSADEEQPDLNNGTIQEPEEEDDNDSVAAPVPHPDDFASDGEEKEDPEEAAKREAFFAKDTPENTSLSKVKSSFQHMRLSRPILRGLTAIGFTEPTPIQTKTVPVALEGRDVVGGAVTGSGKTAAFVLPILERLLYRNKIPTTRVAILTPTRELAVQCHQVATKLAQFTDITFALIVGGLSLREQEAHLRKRPDVVIATPGRFIDHMRNSASFAVDSVEILVLDEADRMLEDGFADELNELLKTIPRSRQTMLFSATMTTGVDNLVRAGLNKPVRIVVDPQKTTVPKLIQEFVKIKTPKNISIDPEDLEHRRLAYLLHLCTHAYTAKTIVFLPTKHLAHRIKILFALRDIQAAELHGSMSQEQRLSAISTFRDGRATHLLATDLASRGLDIPRVETVVNYTVPTTTTTYLHRVGRTARAGQGGVSVTIFEGTKKAKTAPSKGPKGNAGKQTTSERALLRPILKIAKAQKAPLRTRNMPSDAIEALTIAVMSMQSEIDEVLKEEKEERLLQQTERDMQKGENLMKHEDEIKSRPKRTWFQSEKEKKQAKDRGIEERMGLKDGGAHALAPKKKKGKLSGKEKKTLQARDERVAGTARQKRSKASMHGGRKGKKG